MLDHPAITNPDYHTTLVSWYEGGLHFLEEVPPGVEGFSIMSLYFATYILILILGLALIIRWAKKGSFKTTPRNVFEGGIMAFIGGFAGARLIEAIFYHPEFFFSNPRMIVESTSGFSVHGAMIGSATSLYIWSRWVKLPYRHVIDQIAPIVALGTFLGRITNFAIGELYGRASTLPWAMRFPFHDPHGRELVAKADGTTYQVLEKVEGNLSTNYIEPTNVEGFNVLTEGAAYRYATTPGDPNTLETVYRIVTDLRHPSALYQAITEGLILFVVLMIVRSKAKNIGTVAASTLVGYGFSRFIMEFFRQPETTIDYPLFGLTIGQLLSLTFAFLGIAFLRYNSKKPFKIEDCGVKINKTS